MLSYSSFDTKTWRFITIQVPIEIPTNLYLNSQFHNLGLQPHSQKQ